MHAVGAARVLAIGCLFGADAPVPAGEPVFAAFDLAGWRKAGVVTLATPTLESGRPEALIDRDAQTTVLAAPGESAEFRVRFEPAQWVRLVVVHTSEATPSPVRLVVVEPDGGRFQAGAVETLGPEAIDFQLRDVEVAELIVAVDGEDGRGVGLAEIEVTGRIDVESIALEDVPETLPEGGSFPYRVVGIDSHGGRPDLTDRATLVVSPAPALTLLPGHRAETRVQGSLTIQPRMQGLVGLARPVLVTALDPPPPPPLALEGLGVVTLELEGQPPFEILRRLAGETEESSIGRTETRRFHDDTVEPSTAYAYRVQRIDRLENPLSGRSGEARVRTWSKLPPGWVDVGRVPLLVAIFTDSLAPGEPDSLRASAEAARLFLYRHSLGRIVLEPTFLEVSGPTPVTIGPTMLGIEQRLRQLGIRDGRFAVVCAVAGDLPGDYAGFPILGDGIGIMGRGTGVPTPPGAMGPEPGFAWSFVHEMQHVVATLLAPSGPRPSGHFTDDLGPHGVLGAWRGRSFDAGDAWDGQAWLLAELSGWSGVGRPWRRPLEVRDTDGDGLPDADARLPLDEQRFGSDALLPDSDGDGLGDLAEAAAGLYRGSDPTRADTDGDALADGVDPWPLTNFTGVIRWGAQARLLASLPTLADPESPPLELRAGWTESTLLLELLSAAPSDLHVDLDGSGRLGRWESDVNTGTPEAPASDVWAGPAGLSLRAHHAPLGAFVGGRKIPGARVTARREADGRWRLVAALPRSLGPGAVDAYVPAGAPEVVGLRLQPGTVLGLAVTVRPSRADDPEPFATFPSDGEWVSLFETHRLMDAELRE